MFLSKYNNMFCVFFYNSLLFIFFCFFSFFLVQFKKNNIPLQNVPTPMGNPYGKLSGWGLTYGMALLYALNLTF